MLTDGERTRSAEQTSLSFEHSYETSVPLAVRVGYSTAPKKRAWRRQERVTGARVGSVFFLSPVRDEREEDGGALRVVRSDYGLETGFVMGRDCCLSFGCALARTEVLGQETRMWLNCVQIR